ncbi:MAG TPA: hypothetical protein VF533_03020 [Solirubrobacteraceae bacterium]
MLSRPCIRCGKLIASGGYCLEHKPVSRGGSAALRGSGGKRQTWAKRVKAKTGGRCAVPGCRTPTDRVQADHVHGAGDGGDPFGLGIALCHGHHVAVEATKRRANTRR